jgi:hypothetical protein
MDLELLAHGTDTEIQFIFSFQAGQQEQGDVAQITDIRFKNRRALWSLLRSI